VVNIRCATPKRLFRADQGRLHAVAFVFHLVMGEAQRAHAGEDVGAVALGVARLRGRGAVIAQAVGLDDQPEVGPVEVDLPAVDDLFGERRREAGVRGDRAEVDLQVGVG
jgi:hypothetical protein